MLAASRKRGNEWLDTDVGDESDQSAGEQGYDSEAAEERKGTRSVGSSARGTKKARLEGEWDDENADNEEEEELSSFDDEAGDARSLSRQPDLRANSSRTSEKKNTDPPDQSISDLTNPTPLSSTNLNLKPLTPAQLEAHNKRLRKTGVVYISRIPPYMSPSKVRSLLSPYGSLGRVFLTPESSQTHSSRVRSHGNKKRSFVDGWVEFASKKNAKLAAETLNAQIIGGKKGGWYHDDMWNVKYLKGFKWADLVEQVRNEEAERAGRLRVGRERGRREEKEFLKGVEQSKVWEGKERKRKEREERARKTGDRGGGRSVKGEAGQKSDRSGRHDVDEQQTMKQEFPRTFRQNTVKGKSGNPTNGTTSSNGQHQQPEQIKSVLSKIF